jgi:DNA-binding NarL/FixJ family response regulator
MIKVLLVDDHKLILDSLSLLLGLIDDVEIVGTIDDSRKVLDFLSENKVDVLITDLNMPHMDGIELSFKVKEVYPEQKILMLTVNDSHDLISNAFKAGISGYVMKKAGREELSKAIMAIHSGSLYYSQDVMKTLLAGPDEDEGSEKIKTLTKRELEIIKLMAQEKTSGEISSELFISVGTVETHRHNVFKKLGVKNIVGVIKFALKYKLIDD